MFVFALVVVEKWIATHNNFWGLCVIGCVLLSRLGCGCFLVYQVATSRANVNLNS
jgi:hypothetical protein